MIGRLFLLSTLAFFLFCCSPSKNFRKLTEEEASAIKKYQKQIDENDDRYHILILTTDGDMVVKLFNETPLHRDNFVAKVKSGFYDSLLFHRVINNFMIQGGDPTSKHALVNQALGICDAPGGRIPAEFRMDKSIYHKRGALAAARDNNPEKASSNCQFYIVQRPAWRASQLDSAIIKRRLTPEYKDLTLNDEQKRIYTTVGGTPHLDGGYTVFGELEIGFEVLDRIAATKTNRSDRPESDIRMRMFVLREPKKSK